MEGALTETVCESTPEAQPQVRPPAPPAAARSLAGVGTGGLSTHPDRQVLLRVPSRNSALCSSVTCTHKGRPYSSRPVWRDKPTSLCPVSCDLLPLKVPPASRDPSDLGSCEGETQVSCPQ